MENAQKNATKKVHNQQKWINMRIKEELIQDLKKLAAENDRNLTQQINWILKQEIEKHS